MPDNSNGRQPCERNGTTDGSAADDDQCVAPRLHPFQTEMLRNLAKLNATTLPVYWPAGAGKSQQLRDRLARYDSTEALTGVLDSDQFADDVQGEA